VLSTLGREGGYLARQFALQMAGPESNPRPQGTPLTWWMEIGFGEAPPSPLQRWRPVACPAIYQPMPSARLHQRQASSPKRAGCSGLPSRLTGRGAGEIFMRPQARSRITSRHPPAPRRRERRAKCRQLKEPSAGPRLEALESGRAAAWHCLGSAPSRVSRGAAPCHARLPL